MGLDKILEEVVVDVKVKGVDKAAQRANKLAAEMKGLGRKFNSFGKAMSMPFEQWRKFNMEGKKFSSKGAQFANKFRMMTHGLRGFRMEMLGIMFFGMMLQKTMSNLLQPAAEAYGIFDLWGEMLTVLFLPIMQVLFPVFLWLVNWFMNLPESVKLAIGILVVAVLIFGGLLFIVGALGLGLGSLVLAFGALATIGAPMISTLVGIFGGILGMVSSFVLGTKTMQDKGMDIQSVVQGIKDKFAWVFPIIKDLMIGDIGSAMIKIKDVLSTAITFLKDKIILPGFRAIWAFLKALLPEWMTDAITLAWTKLTGFLSEVAQAKSLEDAIDVMLKGITKFTEWGIFIGKEIAAGLIQGLWEGTKGFVKEKFGMDNSGWNNDSGSYGNFNGPSKGDFIWRAGHGAVSISPDDNLIGTKSGMGGGTSYSPTYNVTVFNSDELRRLFAEHDRELMAKIMRNT